MDDKSEKFFVFPLGVGSGSGPGSVSKWKVGSGSASNNPDPDRHHNNPDPNFKTSRSGSASKRCRSTALLKAESSDPIDEFCLLCFDFQLLPTTFFGLLHSALNKLEMPGKIK
jgi:hypothetical protein